MPKAWMGGATKSRGNSLSVFQLSCLRRSRLIPPRVLNHFFASGLTYDFSLSVFYPGHPSHPQILDPEPVHIIQDRRVDPWQDDSRTLLSRVYVNVIHRGSYQHIPHLLSSQCPDDAYRRRFTPRRWLPSWWHLFQKFLRRAQVSSSLLPLCLAWRRRVRGSL